MPFGADASNAYLTPAIETLLQRLEQMTSVHASGMICGPNGVGKSYLMDRFLDQLDDKRYLGVALSHSTLAGSGLLRMLSHLLGKPPRFRREDKITGQSGRNSSKAAARFAILSSRRNRGGLPSRWLSMRSSPEPANVECESATPR